VEELQTDQMTSEVAKAKSAANKMLRELDKITVRPWNFLGVLGRVSGVMKSMVRMCTQNSVDQVSTNESLERCCISDIELNKRIDGTWEENYKNGETMRALEQRLIAVEKKLMQLDGSQNEEL